MVDLQQQNGKYDAGVGDPYNEITSSMFLNKFSDSDYDFQSCNGLRCCHEALASLPHGLSVLDYGTGPSLQETFLLAGKASEIVLSDYSAANRKTLQSWLDGEPDAFEWRPIFQRTMSELEGGRSREGDVTERIEKIRHVVKAVVRCDITQDPPIERGYDVQYDVINSYFCLCVATKTHEEYREGIAKLAKLVKPGGVLMIYESAHETCHLATYRICNRELRYVAVTNDFLLRAFRDAGFSQVTVRFTEFESEHPFLTLQPERIGYYHVTGIKNC